MVTVSELWKTLVSEGRMEAGWHARRIHPQSACDIRVAIREDGVKALLFEVLSRSVPPGADLPDCVGFLLSFETISPGPGGRGRLCLVLKDNRFADVFAALAEDVGTAVSASTDEAAGIRALLGRLNTWERFIMRFGPGRLSDEELVGLYAELYFLRTEVVSIVDHASAIRAWRGPFREPQDFRFRSVAVEVKASAARSPASFIVANLDQLDDTVRDLLLVFHVTVDASSAGGDMLPQLVADIRAVIASSDAGAAIEFDASLVEAGYLDIHAEFYDAGYSVRQAKWFKVADSFPRLTRGTVPLGITEASYGVSLEACQLHMIEAAVGRTAMRERF